MKGLQLERRGEGHYYKVILHIGDCFVPVSDDIIEELKTQTALAADQFLTVFGDKVGYSSYLKEKIQSELTKSGDPSAQANALQQFLRET